MLDLSSISYVNIFSYNMHSYMYITAKSSKEYKSILLLSVYYQMLAHGYLIHQKLQKALFGKLSSSRGYSSLQMDSSWI